jgi:hypothetical protein
MVYVFEITRLFVALRRTFYNYWGLAIAGRESNVVTINDFGTARRNPAIKGDHGAFA